jgi:hypothetical protein
MPFALIEKNAVDAVHAAVCTKLAKLANVDYPLKQDAEIMVHWNQAKNAFMVTLPEPEEIGLLFDFLSSDKNQENDNKDFFISLGEIIAFHWYSGQPSTPQNINVKPAANNTCYPFPSHFDASLSDDVMKSAADIVSDSLSELDKRLSQLLTPEDSDSFYKMVASRITDIEKGFVEEMARIVNIPDDELAKKIKIDTTMSSTELDNFNASQDEYIKYLIKRKDIAKKLASFDLEQKDVESNPRRFVIDEVDAVKNRMKEVFETKLKSYLAGLSSDAEAKEAIKNDDFAYFVDKIGNDVASTLANEFASYFVTKSKAKGVTQFNNAQDFFVDQIQSTIEYVDIDLLSFINKAEQKTPDAKIPEITGKLLATSQVAAFGIFKKPVEVEKDKSQDKVVDKKSVPPVK